MKGFPDRAFNTLPPGYRGRITIPSDDDMLAMRGMIRGPLNVLDRSHAIALLASGFADDPPSTPERAALFTTTLDEDVVR